jgi:hypothetical protein
MKVLGIHQSEKLQSDASVLSDASDHDLSHQFGYSSNKARNGTETDSDFFSAEFRPSVDPGERAGTVSKANFQPPVLKRTTTRLQELEYLQASGLLSWEDMQVRSPRAGAMPWRNRHFI